MSVRRPWPRDDRFLIGDDGSIVGPSGRTLRPFPDRDGYMRFNVHTVGRWSQHSVHVAVCETWHGARPEGMQVAHGNGDLSDNSAANLAWKTPAGNEADKLRHGTRAWGERHGLHKITDEDVRMIRSSSASAAELASLLSISASGVRKIRARKYWKQIP